MANGTTTQYAGGYIYENSSLKFANHTEGYIEPDGGGGYNYVYQYKDHLGNIRLSYSDSNGNGIVDGSEILQERNHYPFGLKHEGYNSQVNGTEYNYKTYQGREISKELDYNMLEFKYRHYDPAIGRFGTIDPLSERYEYQSHYNFSENRVIDGIDLEGLEYVTVRHYMLGDKEMKKTNTLFYAQTNDEINSVGGTTKGIFRSASSGPEGNSGIKHEYIDINTGKQVKDPKWEFRQNSTASKLEYHGLYSGGGSITDGFGKPDYSYQPIDWADAIAKRHDKDYDDATDGYKDYKGYIEDVRTYQADVDMVNRLNSYRKQQWNPFKKVSISGVDNPLRTSGSVETDNAVSGQLLVISALRDYKKWKIGNNYGNDDTFDKVGNQLKEDNLKLWAIIYILTNNKNNE